MLKRCFILFAVATMAATGCKKDENVTPTPTSPVITIPTDKIRLTVTVPTTTKDTDKLSIVGNFPNETWDPKKSAKYELKRTTASEYTIDLAILELPKFGDLEYKVVKNVTATDNADGYKYVEKAADCKELSGNRVITAPVSAGGKEYKIAVANFRNTGTCGD